MLDFNGFSRIGASLGALNMRTRDVAPLAKEASRLPEALAAPESKTRGVVYGNYPQLRFGGPDFPLRFGISLMNDHGIEMTGDTPINSDTVAQSLRGLMLRDMLKGDEPGSLKMFLGCVYANGYYPMGDQSAMADIMTLVSRPVDVIVTSAIGPEALHTLLAASGKAFMAPVSEMMIGPLLDYKNLSGTGRELEFKREVSNEYLRNMETMIMMRSGEKDRRKIYMDLMSAKTLTPMEALHYGTRGLIHGILIGRDKVVTRKELNAYFKTNRMNAKQIKAFLRVHTNVFKLPTQPLDKFSPSSVVSVNKAHYESLKELQEGEAAKIIKRRRNGSSFRQRAKAVAPKAEGPAPAIYIRYFFDNSFDVTDIEKQHQLPLIGKVREGNLNDQIQVTNVPKRKAALARDSILADDVIFFNDDFDFNTAEQIRDAMMKIADKKRAQDKPSNIKIVENSPGGVVWASQELRNYIQALEDEGIKVDLIVQGIGASCGAELLCSVSGNRFATPNTRMMIHQVRVPPPGSLDAYLPHLNDQVDGTNQSTEDYVQVVHKATGRPVELIRKDMKDDVWFNPLEALFYGPKGLIDGILVEHNKVITREDVEAHLLKKLKTKQAVHDYVRKKITGLGQPKHEREPEEFDETDPFTNSIQTIAEMTPKARHLSQVPAFKDSLPKRSPDRSIDYYIVRDRIVYGLQSEAEEKKRALREQRGRVVRAGGRRAYKAVTQ